MQITKTPEVLRLYRICGLLLIIFLTLALLVNFFSFNSLKTGIANNNAAIVGAIIEKYPEAESGIIEQIQQYNQDTVRMGQALLSKYGYNTNDILIENNLMLQNFYNNLILFVMLILIICITYILLFTRFMNNQYSRVNDVTQYARMIQIKDYTLDIRDNSEGDISKLKNEIYKITTMLREQAEALQKEKISLSNSIADISHQLKTPMTSLFVLNDLLSNDPDIDTRNEFLFRIKSQLHRIEWLVSSLLKLSKLDAGTVVMKNEKINIYTLLEKALQPISVPIEIKMLQLDIKGDKSIHFTGDFNWTCEALINILKNCLEHTPEKGCIRISFDVNPIYTVIVISDNGHGIDKEDIPYIFNRFYKGKNASDDSIGIGLAMAKAIIAKQSGDITVESEKGIGTAFTIKFYKTLP